MRPVAIAHLDPHRLAELEQRHQCLAARREEVALLGVEGVRDGEAERADGADRQIHLDLGEIEPVAIAHVGVGAAERDRRARHVQLAGRVIAIG